MTKKTKEDQMSLADIEEAEILARLNERVERAVALIQELRRERDALKSKLEAAEAKVADQENAAERVASLEEENDRFQKERGEIRDRIETILSSLEALEEGS
jgi:FtsZ-binding cell division protein ZapB